MIWTPSTTLSVSPILKIPLLFINAAIVYPTYSPPNPAATTSEASKYGAKGDDPLSRYAPIFRPLASVGKSVHWIYAICEAVVIANAYSSIDGPVRESTLWLVRPGYAPSGIRITPIWLLGMACFWLGSHARVAAFRELGRFFTFELSLKDDQHLVTTGPYAWVRHPSYTGKILVAVGTFLCHIGPGSWARECGWLDTVGGKVFFALWLGYTALVPTLMIQRTKIEDEVLRKQYGGEWDRWAKKTPYRLIPFIY